VKNFKYPTTSIEGIGLLNIILSVLSLSVHNLYFRIPVVRGSAVAHRDEKRATYWKGY